MFFEFTYVDVLLLKNTKVKISRHFLKVNKFQNQFMKSSFFPKYEPKIVRISARSMAHYRAEILTIFDSYFGRNDDFID